MYTPLLVATFSTLLVYGLAHDVHNIFPRQAIQGEFPNEEAKGKTSGSITLSAALGCVTGESGAKYRACSRSISYKIEDCADEDVDCACRLAGKGYGCLTSYCPTHTPALCAASAILSRFCAPYSQPYPTITDFTCSTSIEDLVKSAIATNIISKMPSDLVSVLKGPEETGATSTVSVAGVESKFGGVDIPGPTGAASGLEVFGGAGSWKIEGERDSVRRGLWVGLCVAVLVAGLGGLL